MNADVATPPGGPGPLRRWGERVLAWLVQWVQPLMNPLRVFWLTGWCAVLFAVGAVFFLLNDQGLDLLRRLTEARGGQAVVANVFFFLGVLAWGLSTWYCARLLLGRQFPRTDPTFFERTQGLRTWLPRVGGSLVAFVVAGGFWRVSLWGGAGAVAKVLIAVYVVLGVALFVALWKRRAIFRATLAGHEPHDVADRLSAGSWRVLQVSFVLSFGLLVLLLVFPVSVATALGAPAIVLFAAASWILFGSMVITYWPLVNGYPSLLVPLILAALVMSWWNDNHTIRSTKVKDSAAARQAPQDHFRDWLTSRLEGAPADRPYPVFVVASAGGGIRAAYWTASVLGRIADDSGGTWPQHVYAMSGVSGGSVGSALHAVQLVEQAVAPGAAPGFAARAQRSLDNDILSPVLSYFLFPDLIQRFSPIPFSFADRARAIERALESAVADRQGANSDRFGRRFLELWPQAAPYRVPVLLLNTTVVETGQRGIVSNLVIDDSFTDAVDLLGAEVRTQDMAVSTAAHLSARFTYVSPAGTIRTPKGEVWGHIVDGGYFENSGAATALELMQRMRVVAEQAKPRRVALNLILIRNDPEAPNLCEAGAAVSPPSEPYTYLNDLLSPVRALLSTRVARGRLAEESALNLVRSFHGGTASIQSPLCRDGCVFEFSLGGGDIEPPLGWSLSDRAKDQMNAHLGKQDHKFACIRGLLTGAGCDAAPTCAARR